LFFAGWIWPGDGNFRTVCEASDSEFGASTSPAQTLPHARTEVSANPKASRRIMDNPLLDRLAGDLGRTGADLLLGAKRASSFHIRDRIVTLAVRN
jgi:hypothetical protein